MAPRTIAGVLPKTARQRYQQTIQRFAVWIFGDSQYIPIQV